MIDIIVKALLGETKIDPAELAKGTKDEEEEHDMAPPKARKTALQHLRRVDPHYYTKTEKCLKPKPKANMLSGVGMNIKGDMTGIGIGGGGGV